MTTRRTPDVKPAAEQPPYYIADQALDIDYVRAFNPGDQVPVGHIDKYGWADMVHAPESPAVERNQQTTEPETASGQASTEGKGDA